MIGEEYGAYFTVSFNYQGMPAKKFAAIIYKNDKLYQWAVQEIKGISRQDGLVVFNAYVEHFKIE